MIVGPLEYARAFLRAVVATGLYEPNGLTSYSWPDRGQPGRQHLAATRHGVSIGAVTRARVTPVPNQ